MKTIKKIITISALHVSESTFNLLGKEIGNEVTENNLTDFFEIYKASEWGYILNFNGSDNIPDILKHKYQVPEDLQKVLQYANENGCDMLQLDVDGEIVGDLPIYVDGEIISNLPIYDNECLEGKEEEDEEEEFELTYYETYEGTYAVKASNLEEAKEQLLEDIRNGHENGPDQCVDSGFREDEETETNDVNDEKWKELEDDLRKWHENLDNDLANVCLFNEAERNVLFNVRTEVESLLLTYFEKGFHNENGK